MSSGSGNSAPSPFVSLASALSSLHAPPLPLPLITTDAASTTASASASPSPSKQRRRSSAGRNAGGAGHRRRSSVANTELMVESFSSGSSVSPSPSPSPLLEAQPQFQMGASNSDVPVPHMRPHDTAEGAPATNKSALAAEAPMPRERTRQEPMATDADADADVDGDNLLDESVMNLADTSEVTTAFKSHFIFPRSSLGGTDSSRPRQSLGFVSSGADDGSAGEGDLSTASGMDVAQEGEDVTSAFALNTHLFGHGVQTGADAAIRRSSSSDSISLNGNGTHRQSSPSKKVRAELQRRESLNLDPASSAGATANEDRFVPLGSAGVDEEAVERARREKARRGSLAFYNPVPGVGQLFAAHHEGTSTNGDADSGIGGDMEPEDEMDMSIADTRRVSNVFALAFHRDDIDEDEEEQSGKRAAEKESSGETGTGSPSPVKPPSAMTPSLYPSLDGLAMPYNNGTSALQPQKSRTQGEDALAFLDGDEEDEGVSHYQGRDEREAEAELEQLRDIRAEAEAEARQVPDEAARSIQASDHGKENTQEEHDAPAYSPLPDPVFVPRQTRLSVVPERFDEEDEEEEEEEEEEDDRTQDMDETGVYGTISQSAQPRRLSVLHPSTLQKRTAASPSPKKSVFNSGSSKAFIETQAVSKIPRRQSLAAPATSMSSESAASQLFRSVPASAAPQIPSASASSVPAQTTLAPEQGTPPASRRQSLGTGLTPSMRRLSDWAASRSPQPAAAAVAPAPPPAPSPAHNNNAPASEPFFDEAAPHEAEEPHADGVAQQGETISLEQFLSMADMQFMDGLLSASQAAPSAKHRKSAFASAAGGAMGSNANGEVTLAEQVTASGAVIPMMESLQLVRASPALTPKVLFSSCADVYLA